LSSPQICVSVPCINTVYVLEKISKLVKVADLIEVRLDYLKGELDLDAIRASTPLPIIATNRVVAEGGFWDGDEGERIDTVLSAIDAGFDYADLELVSDLHSHANEIRKRGGKLIASHHELERPPSITEMENILKTCKTAGAKICKIVNVAHNYRDNLTCLDFVARNPGNVSFCTGTNGIPSRILSPLLGGAFTYASTDEGQELAPGQLTAVKMRQLYRLMGVTS
jgi:3-dehydroquinate dehydratase type I